MTKNRLAALGAALRAAVIPALLALTFSAGATPARAQANAGSFYHSITGEWIGTCAQSTDGQQAENKYFHAIVKQVSPCSYNTSFEYYRMDKDTGKPIRIGGTSVATTVSSDGTAQSKIVGSGLMFVNGSPKNQQHELTEVARACSSNSLAGQDNGTISVSGMPLGLGKNGKIKNAQSSWEMKNGTLYIDQKLTAGFKAFFFTKSFDVELHSIAMRGSDVVSLMTGQVRLAARPCKTPAAKS